MRRLRVIGVPSLYGLTLDIIQNEVFQSKMFQNSVVNSVFSLN